MFITESESEDSHGLGILFLELGDGGGILRNIGRFDIENDFIELTECKDQLDLLLPGVIIACGELVDHESAKTAALIHDNWLRKFGLLRNLT
jgi:hypothetical protein